MSRWTRFRDRIAKKILEWLGIEPDPEPAPPQPPAPETAPIDWRFGDFDGSHASVDPVNVIAGLHVSIKKLSYHFERGDLANWGVGRGDATAIAAAFYWDDVARKWIGGKFEWVDAGRLVRPLDNIYPGPDGKAYGGWRSDLFFAAPKRAYCIAKKDGTLRTNLIETTEP